MTTSKSYFESKFIWIRLILIWVRVFQVGFFGFGYRFIAHA